MSATSRPRVFMKHKKRKLILGALPTLGVVLATTNAKADDVSPKAVLTPSPEIKTVPKGEQNFNATVSLTSSAGLGSGTLINEDTIVTVAHNFVHLEGSNPITVADNVKKQGQVHTATLPDGSKVTFSNDDIKFWNREGFINGFKNDLAVVKLKNKFTGKKAANITTSAKTLKQGDTIHVFGYPQGKLQPILNEKVQTVENYGANIMGIGYKGSHPGASGGGMYDDKGNLIGVHQNGVVGVRSGGITFSKEQLDWITAIARGENATPVYLPDEPRNDDKDKDKGKHGKLVEVDDQSWTGWIGALYEDGTYVIKGVKDKNVALNNPNGAIQTMFGGDSDKLGKIKRIEVDGVLKADLFDLGSYIYPMKIDLTGLSLSDKTGVPFLVYKLEELTSLTLGKDFKLNKDSTLSRFIDGAPKLKLTNEQVTQILKDLALVGKSYDGPLLRNVGVERLDLSTFDNSKIDPRNYNEHLGSDESGKSFKTKSVFKDLIGLKEVIFGDKFDFEKYGRKNTPDAFMDTDLSGVMKVTLVGKKPGNDKFIKDWLNEVKTKFTRTDLGEVALLKDGVFVNTVNAILGMDNAVYDGGIYTLGYSRTENEVVKHGYKYASDSSVPFNTKVLQIEGQDGDRLVTYVYTVSPTGEVSAKPIRFADENYVGTMLDGTYLVGNQSNEIHEIDVVIRYVSDDSKPLNEQEVVEPGSKGLRTIITTYSVSSETGELFSPVVTEEHKPMSERIIKVGTKPKIIEQILEPEIEYVSDPTREQGTDNIATVGPKGKSVTTTTYRVDPKTGKVTELVGKPVVTPPINTVIKVGTKPKVTTTPIASPIEYILDKKKPRTSPNETKPGKAGSTVTTINYTVDPNTGKAIPGNPITETTPPTKTIITVGGRDDEETEVIPPEIEYVPDDTNSGETIQGKPGKKVTPITYTIDPNTGTVTPHKGEPIITPSTKTIIKVSTKPKVVTEDIEPGTRYEADPSRDKGTPNVTIPGKKGKKVTTTTYTLDKATGKTIEHTDKPVIAPPVDTIIKVGTKTKVITEIMEPGIEYVRDDNNTGEKIQGKPGKKVITITYTVDPNTGNVTENTDKPEITPPINTIVKIGTKDDVINEPIEPEVIYEGDDTRDANTPNVTIPGKQGKKTTLITYELEPGTGKRIEKRGTPRVTPPINTIVKVGTKPKVVTKVIEPEVIYEGDVTRDANTPNVTIPGKKGFTSITTTYTVDPKTGKLTEKTTEKNEAPGKTIVNVGSKPKVVTELIDPEVLYEGDDTQDVNAPNVTIPGTKGTKTTTTTYTVDLKTGKLIEKTTENGTKPGTTRIKVGTKPTVKRVTDPNGDVYEETTTYTVDPKTGKVTPDTTRKLISKAPAKDPNDGAKAGNGIDENGNPIEPPVLEVPEYTGVIADNGLDGKGNIIEPPVLEVPEYKGDLNDKPKQEPKAEKPKAEKPTSKEQPKKKLPETGDNKPAYLVSLVVIGIGLLRRKRQK